MKVSELKGGKKGELRKTGRKEERKKERKEERQSRRKKANWPATKMMAVGGLIFLLLGSVVLLNVIGCRLTY